MSTNPRTGETKGDLGDEVPKSEDGADAGSASSTDIPAMGHPQPATLGALALGALGLTLWRKTK